MDHSGDQINAFDLDLSIKDWVRGFAEKAKLN